MLAYALVAVLVYTPSSGGAAGALSEIKQGVRRALRSGGNRIVEGALERGRAEAALGWVAASELAFFGRGRALADEGRRRLERVELDEAERAFAAAEELYERELARPGVAALWSQAALGHGVALFELGRAAPARAAWRRALALEPSAALTEATVRPDVVRAFTDAVRVRGGGRLTITSEPAAELFVDGRAVGHAPQALDVNEGDHLVVARADGRQGAAALVPVSGAVDATLALAVDPRAAALDELRARPTAAGIAALTELAVAERVVAVAAGVNAGDLTLVGTRATTGCATAPVKVSVHGAGAGALEAAVASLVERLGRAPASCPGAPEAIVDDDAVAHPRPAPVAAPAPVRPPKPKPRFYERPWLWVGALVVTSVGVILGATLGVQDTTYRARVDGSAFTK